MSFVTLETDVRRAWAALRFVDAMTRRTIDTPLAVDLPGARLRRNPRGLWVVLALDAAPGDTDGAADASSTDAVAAASPAATSALVSSTSNSAASVQARN